MVAVTAIVTGLPGGTIEKNRNADLLSPAALVDGMLGNRVTITRTNPATGRGVSEDAVIRTRADGGLVLQTSQGFEAVRCSGLPEKLTFDRVPAGLSASPVYSIDTRAPAGGTYTVTLTYLSWGFDWQAHYVATLDEGRAADDVRMRLTSWLTLVNDNGQSFPEAELMAVAGKLNVTSDYRALADPPQGRPLQLTCYPLGSTADGSPVPWNGPYPPPPPPPPPMMAAPMAARDAGEAIMVTGSRMSKAAVIAREEDLADLKLYRVPEPVTVEAQSQKQIAFLDTDGVKGALWHTTTCAPWSASDRPRARCAAPHHGQRRPARARHGAAHRGHDGVRIARGGRFAGERTPAARLCRGAGCRDRARVERAGVRDVLGNGRGGRRHARRPRADEAGPDQRQRCARADAGDAGGLGGAHRGLARSAGQGRRTHFRDERSGQRQARTALDHRRRITVWTIRPKKIIVPLLFHENKPDTSRFRRQATR